MDNWYLPGWPSATAAEPSNWSHCNAAEQSFLVPWPLPQPHELHGFPPWSIPIDGVAEDRAASASKSHSQAEKRRRDRINSQLATLRKLIPKSDKMDKAALLGSVIDHVKELNRKAAEVGKSLTVPTEIDEVTIDCEVGGKEENMLMIKASVCCDDRPELFGELIRVLQGLRLTTVRADMASVGGRIKSILVLCNKDSEANVCPTALKQSLKGVLGKIVSSSSLGSNCHPRSKRQRFFLPSPPYSL